MDHRTIQNSIPSIMIAIAILGISSNANAAPNEVAILSTSVVDGLASPEAVRIDALGFDPVLITPEVWQGMSTEEFAQYEALVFGDPMCEVDAGVVTAAAGNAATWAAAVDGNVIVLGTDPSYHITYGPGPGPQALNDNALAFALADAGTGITGAYIALSCYYHFSPEAVVPLLSGFGDFTIQGASQSGALNDVHIVAAHPSLDGLTDELLSNWYNSVHEHFLSWPNDFEVLALALSDAGSFVTGDGSVGFPYLLARGVIPAACGDGNLDPAEECDDGNNEDGDGCDAACNAELVEARPRLPEEDGCPEDDGDDDLDGVCNSVDLCADSDLLPWFPDEPTADLGVNRFSDTDGDGIFETVGPQIQDPAYTMETTAGCNCKQIIDALGLGQGHSKFGCSIGAMNQWLAFVAQALPFVGGGVELGGLQSPNALPDPEADATDTLQVSGCSLGDEPSNGPAWAFLGLMLAVIGRRRRS